MTNLSLLQLEIIRLENYLKGVVEIPTCFSCSSIEDTTAITPTSPIGDVGVSSIDSKSVVVSTTVNLEVENNEYIFFSLITIISLIVFAVKYNNSNLNELLLLKHTLNIQDEISDQLFKSIEEILDLEKKNIT